MYGSLVEIIFKPTDAPTPAIANPDGVDYVPISTRMLSERNDGASISEVTGKYLGSVMHNVMRVFSVLLLVLIGVVFMVGPAGLLALLTPDWLNVRVWTIIILFYYFLATLLPIDKIIGKIYPVFGVLLILSLRLLVVRWSLRESLPSLALSSVRLHLATRLSEARE